MPRADCSAARDARAVTRSCRRSTCRAVRSISCCATSRARASRSTRSPSTTCSLELASADDDEALREKLSACCRRARAGEIVDGTIAESEAQRRSPWAAARARARSRAARRRLREARRLGSHRPIPEFIAAPSALARIAPHRLSIYGHIGDGNLHFNLLPPAGQGIEAFRAARADAFSTCVHDLAKLAGSFSAEHGVGILKRRARALRVANRARADADAQRGARPARHHESRQAA